MVKQTLGALRESCGFGKGMAIAVSVLVAVVGWIAIYTTQAIASAKMDRVEALREHKALIEQNAFAIGANAVTVGRIDERLTAIDRQQSDLLKEQRRMNDLILSIRMSAPSSHN